MTTKKQKRRVLVKRVKRAYRAERAATSWSDWVDAGREVTAARLALRLHDISRRTMHLVNIDAIPMVSVTVSFPV